MATLKTDRPENIETVKVKVDKVPARQGRHPLDKVIGIFQQEPLMDALMDRVREDRRSEMEADTAE